MWTWDDVHKLDCSVEAVGNESEGFVLYCSKLDIRVTYIDNDAPVISNPYPASGCVGISPVLNITVSDGDGDSMNITWYSNSTSKTLILRPMANGSATQLESYPGSAANYECVDEAAVNDSDYVKWKGNTWKKDTYLLSNHAGETGTINHVKVYARCARTGNITGEGATSYAKITIQPGEGFYYSDQFKPPYTATPPFTYSNYSWIWTINPDTGNAWTWNDIDYLEAGISFIGQDGTSRCTHLYVEVNYNDPSTWIVFGANNSVNNGTYHQTFSDASVNGQWWYWKAIVSDGIDNTASSVYKFYTGSQSKIGNTGSTDIKGYLLMQVQYYNETSEDWVVADDTVNETTPRTIDSNNQLGLDTIFNGLVNSNDLSEFGDGTYRVYAAFRDPDGNILVTDDETELFATYEFTVTFD